MFIFNLSLPMVFVTPPVLIGDLRDFWDGEKLQVGICEYDVDKVFVFLL